MKRPARLQDGLPITVWAGAGVLGTGLLVAAVAALGLVASGRWSRGDALVLTVAALVAAGCGGVAVRGVRPLVRGLRSLERDALLRLSVPVRGESSRPVVSHRELTELGRALNALVRRVRLADDIAERHRQLAQSASAGMFELLSGLVAAEEGARGQLAAELHDTVAQTLMAARSMLTVERAVELEPEAVRRAAELVAEAEEQVRAVMARTRPPALRDGDLALAVADLCDDLHQRYALTVDLQWPAQPRPLPLATAVTAYRFFQEALLNVVKHADIDAAVATLRVDDRHLLATVRDRGPGFAPDDVRPARGRQVGLGLLKERARLAGGALEVTSSPGDGTTLTLRLPLGASASLVPAAVPVPVPVQGGVPMQGGVPTPG